MSTFMNPSSVIHASIIKFYYKNQVKKKTSPSAIDTTTGHWKNKIEKTTNQDKKKSYIPTMSMKHDC